MATVESTRQETATRQPHRFSVEQYHLMIDSGVFQPGDRCELIEGVILDMSPMGNPHHCTVSQLHLLISHALPEGWFASCQVPVQFAASEPEPDLAIVRGRPMDYLERKPGGRDTPIIIEVAESSLDSDRTVKRAIYEDGDVAEYWIVNLVDGVVEVYRRDGQTDRYREPRIFRQEEAIPVVLDGVEVVSLPVAEILPPER